MTATIELPISDSGYQALIQDVLDGIVNDDFRTSRLFKEQSELSDTLFEKWYYDIDYTQGVYHIALQNPTLGECEDVEIINLLINKQLATMNSEIADRCVEKEEDDEEELTNYYSRPEFELN